MSANLCKATSYYLRLDLRSVPDIRPPFKNSGHSTEGGVGNLEISGDKKSSPAFYCSMDVTES